MTRKMPVWIVTAAAGAFVLAASSAAGQGHANPDSKFVMAAAEGGMAEVEMGRLAADKGTNPDVKKFGQRMVADHTKANDELKEVVGSKGIALPTELSAAHKKKLDEMSKMSGAAFDKAYIADMVKDHKEDVGDFKKEAASGKDADVKAFAGKTLPTLQDHLKMAQETNAKLGK